MLGSMWALMASVLTARRGQATIVALVTLVACTALTVAPAYAAAAIAEVEVAAVAGTPIDQRLISITRRLGANETGAPDPVAELRRSFEPAGFIAVTGGYASGDLDRQVWGAPLEAALAHRDQVCDALVVTGDCPTAAGEVLLPAAEAVSAELSVGDEVEISQYGQEPRALRVVGVYQVQDPTDPYWADGAMVGLGRGADPNKLTLFTAPATLAEFDRVTYTYDLVATAEAFRGVDAAALWADLNAQLGQARRVDFSVTTDLAALVERIGAEQRNVTVGVTVGVAILLVFTWFTLAVALRGAAAQIRGDVGWWRLHGVPSGRGWVAVVGQGAVPLLAGAALGVAAGVLLALGLPIEGAARARALTLASLLVGLAVVGGLVAAVASQLGTLRTPVRELIRRIPARRPRWRRSLVDIALVVLATLAVGQALTVGRDADGMALLAPAMATLAVALTAAWLLPPFVASLGGRALRAGRLAGALVSASLTRRGGVQPMFSVAAVAVGLLTTGLIGWDTQARAQWERAALESGADRVITVAPVDPARLLAAVRSVDPAGTEAMAVVRRPVVGGQPPVLAVDSPRLGVVVDWREQYGGEVARVAQALRPVAPDPVLVTAQRISVTAAGADPTGAEVNLRLLWYTSDSGEPVSTVVGPLSAGVDSYVGELPGCEAGCRLAALQVLGPPADETGHAPPGAGTWVEVHGLVGDGVEVDSGVLTDPIRWRPAVGQSALGPVLTAGDSALRMTVPSAEGDLVRDDWAYFVDTPVRAPVVSSRWFRGPVEELRLSALPGEPVPVEEVMTTSLLPLSRGDGVLIDLEYAERLRPAFAPPVGAEVWLAASAPDSIVDALQAAGLTPLREETLATSLSHLRAEGSAVAVRFQAAVALIGLLLAAGVVLVAAAQERSQRAAELAALRAQGVGARVIRAVSYGQVMAVVAAATVVGVVAGVVGAAVARVLHPGFVDGWRLLPPPMPRPGPVVVAALFALVALGAAAVAAAAPLLRRSRQGTS